MTFSLNASLEILERTPDILESMLRGISGNWSAHNEGPDTWSPYDIVGHFIHGEKTDWIPRMEIILSEEKEKTFQPFDRFAMFTDSQGKSLEQLIDEFRLLRRKNLTTLRAKHFTDFSKTGIHPEFGKVTLQQLLATWVVHDLNHLAQVARVLAKQYQDEVGPWVKYLGILK